MDQLIKYLNTNKQLRDGVLISFAALLIVLAVIITVCAVRWIGSDGVLNEPSSVEEVSAQPAYVPENTRQMLLDEAVNIVSAMSVEDKVGQLLLIRSNGLSLESFAQLAAECKVGGVVLFGENIEGQTESSMREYISTLQSAAGGRLLVCVDEEGGTVVRLSSNPNLRTNAFSSPQFLYLLGGMDAIREDTVEKCAFLREYGVNVNFAPVADVVTSKKGFLYRRAFGKGAEQTAEYVSEVVGIMEQEGMGSCIKHFPGYGNTSGDTHNGLVTVDTAEEIIRAQELLPFAAGIAAGADSVMVTHTIISDIDAERPATLSPAIISILRDDLGFDGVIISDAMDMGAIKEYTGGSDPCVAGFLAGLDLLCTPSDAKAAYDALLTAVREGVISPERLDESVIRIVLWKMELGLYEIDG